MTDDNDFFDQGGGDGDRTVFVPRPTGRRSRSRTGGAQAPAQAAPQAAPQVQPAARPQAPVQQSAPPQQTVAPGVSGSADVNIINAAATPLVSLGVHLRMMNNHPDSTALFQQICHDLKAFDQQLTKMGVAKESIVTARYILCTFLDEMVMSTPWGGQSIWTTKSLLLTFHNNNLGGVRFFEIINLLLQNPASNLDLLELCYLILAQGFEGRYRLVPTGRAELSKIQDNLYQVVCNLRPEVQKRLSTHWQGAVSEKKSLMTDNKGLIIAVAASLILMVGAFCGFLFSLSNQSDPVAIQAAAILNNTEALVRKNRPVKKNTHYSYIRSQLENEIAADTLSVKEIPGGVKILLKGNGLFKSSSAALTDARKETVRNVAQALQGVHGPIQVTGHTDNIPIRTVQFPSNWELSRQRAGTVVTLMKQSLSGRDISSEGSADSVPLVPNDTSANRATNRRIEINIFAI